MNCPNNPSIGGNINVFCCSYSVTVLFSGRLSGCSTGLISLTRGGEPATIELPVRYPVTGPPFCGSNVVGYAKKTGWGCSRPWQRGLPHTKRGQLGVRGLANKACLVSLSQLPLPSPSGSMGTSVGFNSGGCRLRERHSGAEGWGEPPSCVLGGVSQLVRGARGIKGAGGCPRWCGYQRSSRIVTGPRFRIPAPEFD